MTKRRKDRDPLRTAAALGDRHLRVGCPSAAPPSEAPGMPLNLDLAQGKVILLNYPELMEVCLLPSGGEGLLFFSGAAVTIEGIPVGGFKQRKSIRSCPEAGRSKPQLVAGLCSLWSSKEESLLSFLLGGVGAPFLGVPWPLDTSLQSLCQSSHGLLPVCVCVQVPLFL